MYEPSRTISSSDCDTLQAVTGHVDQPAPQHAGNWQLRYQRHHGRPAVTWIRDRLVRQAEVSFHCG